MFASQLGEPPSVFQRAGIRERRLDFVEPLDRVGESIAKAQLSFPYFCRNRSTRPAVSTSFCLPVKNG